MSEHERPVQDNVHWTLENVVDALRGLRFGAVILTVQDGVVVQVERTEKRRFQSNRRVTQGMTQQ
jgi:hypothetical protein